MMHLNHRTRQHPCCRRRKRFLSTPYQYVFTRPTPLENLCAELSAPLFQCSTTLMRALRSNCSAYYMKQDSTRCRLRVFTLSSICRSSVGLDSIRLYYVI